MRSSSIQQQQLCSSWPETPGLFTESLTVWLSPAISSAQSICSPAFPPSTSSILLLPPPPASLHLLSRSLFSSYFCFHSIVGLLSFLDSVFCPFYLVWIAHQLSAPTATPLDLPPSPGPEPRSDVKYPRLVCDLVCLSLVDCWIRVWYIGGCIGWRSHG